MSKQNKRGSSEPRVELDEFDKKANELYEKNELTMMDVLGNEFPFDSQSDKIINEMVTGEEIDLPVGRVLPVIKHLQGKILTIVDATYDDKERAKFVKDLVKDAFSSSSNWIYEMSIREFEGGLK